MIRRSLAKAEGSFTADDAVNVALGLRLYPLGRYMDVWWKPPPSQIRAINQQLHLALKRQPEALLQVEQFKSRLAEQEAARPAREEALSRWRSLERRLLLFRERPLNVVLHADPPPGDYAAAVFRFELKGDTVQVRLAVSGKVVGWVDAKNSRFPVDQIACWEWVEGVPPVSGQRLSLSRRSLFLRLQPVKSPDLDIGSAVARPEPLPVAVQYVASSQFNEDLARLQRALGLAGSRVGLLWGGVRC